MVSEGSATAWSAIFCVLDEDSFEDLALCVIPLPGRDPRTLNLPSCALANDSVQRRSLSSILFPLNPRVIPMSVRMPIGEWKKLKDICVLCLSSLSLDRFGWDPLRLAPRGMGIRLDRFGFVRSGSTGLRGNRGLRDVLVRFCVLQL